MRVLGHGRLASFAFSNLSYTLRVVVRKEMFITRRGHHNLEENTTCFDSTIPIVL